MSTISSTLRRRSARLAGTVAVTVALVASGAAAASAQGGNGVTRSGSCSAASTWKLKAKHDNARIQVVLEVDSNVVGQTWAVRILDNGTQVVSTSATTVAPSGSFTVSRRVANRAGSDRFVATATNARTGETCRAALTLP